MPIVRIEIEEGRSTAELAAISGTVMDSIVEALQLLPDDKNVMLREYKKGLFSMKAPYCMLIEIMLFSGRSLPAKRNLYALIVNRLEEKGLFSREQVFIVLNEQPKDNWGIRGGIAASDVDLGFKVNI